MDHLVWVLQRLFERSEERFVGYLWRAFRLVQDIDDRRETGQGVYYTQKKPLNAAALKWRGEIESQGYSIARTAARQSHGVEPNFVPSNSHIVVV
ncbi:MAG: hypothetical protein OXN17_08070 [Candidatus Poribacteria bacterium]|nr:hypothetical protein [Candidatus Poribacteria bacterium]